MINGPRDTIKRARKLRSEMSLPQTMLWAALRKRPDGFKFRREHPAGRYILDFYCVSARLAIEVDGFAHDSARAAAMDRRRSEWLRSQGVATLRVPARVVLDDVDAAVERIAEVCSQRVERLARDRPVPLHHPAGGPPPPVGED